MLTRTQKIQYLLHSTLRYLSPIDCPSCGHVGGRLVDRKFWVTRLFECPHCALRFRHPADSIETNRAFYQTDYIEGDGITTDLPTQAELETLLATGFNITGARSAQRLAKLFKALVGELSGKKVIDYGSSWGYISYQLKLLGMDVESFEISAPRAEFGNRELGVNIRTKEIDLRRQNDIFFSSHVIEHVPDPLKMLEFAQNSVLHGGVVVTLCPNGSDAFKRRNPEAFKRSWGKVHPNFITDEFCKRVASNDPYFLTSSNEGWNRALSWDGDSQLTDFDMDQDELLFIWRPVSK